MTSPHEFQPRQPADESTYRVGGIFYIQQLMWLRFNSYYALIGPMVMLEVDWIDRVALLLDLRRGRFIEAPLHIICPPERPLSATHARRLEEFFCPHQSFVNISRRGSRLSPPDTQLQVFQVLRENLTFVRRPTDSYRVLTRHIWRSSIFGPLFEF